MVGEAGSSPVAPLPGGQISLWRSASWSGSRNSTLDEPGSGCASGENDAGNAQLKHRSAPLLTRRPNRQKVRSCLRPLQPLAISRRSLKEWPDAGSDDVGVWPQPPTTPGVNADVRKLRDSAEKVLPPLKSLGKRDQIAFFDKECSKVADHIYFGGDSVARNREILHQHEITHVLNCVGFMCAEYFNSEFVYKTLWLQDSPTEDITSILYDVFDYFEDVRQQLGRVFVHCCHGVSRSTSLVIAYLMWREGQSFDDAFRFVKAARGIANPNMGFACQLLQCQKRVHALPPSPNSVLRVYRMAPHSPYDPLHLVPKMLHDTSIAALDSRGAFIIQVRSSIFVWIGRFCSFVMVNDASAAAFQVVRYEGVQGPILMIREGEEPLDFWKKFLNAMSSVSTNVGKVQIELADKIAVGKRRVEAYDADFDLFNKALTGGIVPPFPSPEHEYVTLLPARESNWTVLRRKFIHGSIMFPDATLGKAVNTCADRMQLLDNAGITNSPAYTSPSSVFSYSSTRSNSSSESCSNSPSACSSTSPMSSSHNMSSPLLLQTGSSQKIPTITVPSFPSRQTVCSPSKGLAQSLAERRGFHL